MNTPDFDALPVIIVVILLIILAFVLSDKTSQFEAGPSSHVVTVERVIERPSPTALGRGELPDMDFGTSGLGRGDLPDMDFGISGLGRDNK